jgi:hypothetical protein
MKTVILFLYCTETPSLKFYVAEKDLSHLDGVFINGGWDDDEGQEKEDELATLLGFNEEAPLGVYEFASFPRNQVTDGAKVIVAGAYF